MIICKFVKLWGETKSEGIMSFVLRVDQMSGRYSSSTRTGSGQFGVGYNFRDPEGELFN